MLGRQRTIANRIVLGPTTFYCNVPAYVVGTNEIAPKLGFENCILTVAESPVESSDTSVTVRKGEPPKLPVAFVSVTPEVSDARTI